MSETHLGSLNGYILIPSTIVKINIIIILLGDLTVRCVGPEMSDVPVQLLDNYDGTHSVKVTPAEPGRHILNILFGGEHVLGIEMTYVNS